MGFLGLGNKENAQGPPMAPAPAPSAPPVDRVMSLRQQGLSNHQIIQSLQNQGFDSNLIFDALNQADIKGGVEQVPFSQDDVQTNNLQNPMQPPQFNVPVDPPDDTQPPPLGNAPPPMPGGPPMGAPPPMAAPMEAPMPGAPMGPPGGPPMGAPPPMEPLGPLQSPPMGDMPPDMDMPADMGGGSLERIEEIAEAIIDEKWNEIVKSINKIIDWKDRTESRMIRIEQQLVTFRQDFDNLTKGVLGKVGEYDSNLKNIGSDIKAMEQVFQKVLPSLTENVHALDRIAGDMKKKK